ncbi:hypothetical protein [Burkholderia seminalis]|uniref:hypothetical protein n=1 Tax=Burkholderia seminalis TaxID=488731 RepID=UPI0014549A71|nr:hypothetical protein [Burkholderia seminalis]MCA8435345.1 hypothetical protein [Burkholderia seminalis]VWC35729.1 hypothetical protein BSE24067_06672 [Burkholderia seminalis]
MANSNSTPAQAAPENATELAQLDRLLVDQIGSAWKIHNTLAFMVEALPDDVESALPVHCTLVDLKLDMDKLASAMMNLGDQMRRCAMSNLGATENAPFTSEYRKGVAAAVDQLRVWKTVEMPNPRKLARQWESGVSQRLGDQRAGFSETIAAYLWGLMCMGEPYLDNWDPLEDIAETEVSHG